MNRWFYRSLFVILSMVYSCFLIDLAGSNSPVMSEDAHLASGAGHYKYHRFDLYRVNPPLVRLIAVLPVKKELVTQENVWWRYDTNPLKRSEFEIGIDVVRRSYGQ
jgi:hypothetical protein